MDPISWIEQIEDALVQRLRSGIGTEVAAIEPFPEDIKNHQLKHPKGAVLVSFAGSKYGKTHSAGVINQTRMIHFDIMVRYRNRRGHQGGYSVLDAARILLTGFQTEGSTKFAPVADGFLFQKDGVWNYFLQVASEIPNVECPTILPIDNMGDVLLTHVSNLNPNYGDIEVPE